MTSDEVREIVRDELARWEEERRARYLAREDQWKAERVEKFREEPSDGLVTRDIKRMLRGGS